MKVLVYGARGWIGSTAIECLRTKYPFVEIVASKLRVDNIEDVQAELDEIKPDRVLCAIGRTNGTYEGKHIPTIDYLEKPGKLRENIRDNLFAPVSLALQCKQRGIHLTYLGTGCIFTYSQTQKVFTEKDTPNFYDSSYSTVKGFTDSLMKQFDNVLNLRIRMPISFEVHPRNLIIKLVGYSKICSIPNSMTVFDDLIPILCKAMVEGVTGTFNFVNPGNITHQEILEMYKEIINPEHKYELVDYDTQMKFLAAGRSNNELSTDKLTAKFGPIPHIKEAVRNCLGLMHLYS